MNTAEGSPRRRAIVRSSLVVLRTAPSTWSTSTSTSLMSKPRASSDELLAREEVDQRLGATAGLVRDDLAGGARRTRLGRLDRGPRGREADLVSADSEVTEREGLDRLLLRGHDALEGRVASLTRLVSHRKDEGKSAL